MIETNQILMTLTRKVMMKFMEAKEMNSMNGESDDDLLVGDNGYDILSEMKTTKCWKLEIVTIICMVGLVTTYKNEGTDQTTLTVEVEKTL